MLRIVTLTRKDMIERVADKDIEQIQSHDFKGNVSNDLVKSDVVIFVDEDKFKVLKHRFEIVVSPRPIEDFAKVVLEYTLPAVKK